MWITNKLENRQFVMYLFAKEIVGLPLGELEGKSCEQWVDVSRNWIQFGGLCQGKEQNWWKRWGQYILRLELNWFARLADDQNEYQSINIRTSNEGKHYNKKRPGEEHITFKYCFTQQRPTTLQGGKIQAQVLLITFLTLKICQLLM